MQKRGRAPGGQGQECRFLIAFEDEDDEADEDEEAEDEDDEEGGTDHQNARNSPPACAIIARASLKRAQEPIVRSSAMGTIP